MFNPLLYHNRYGVLPMDTHNPFTTLDRWRRLRRWRAPGEPGWGPSKCCAVRQCLLPPPPSSFPCFESLNPEPCHFCPLTTFLRLTPDRLNHSANFLRRLNCQSLKIPLAFQCMIFTATYTRRCHETTSPPEATSQTATALPTIRDYDHTREKHARRVVLIT